MVQLIDRFVKNADSVEHIWSGKLLSPGEYYRLVEDYEHFASDSKFLEALSSGQAKMSRTADESGEIDDLNEAINFLKGVEENRDSEGNLITSETPRLGSSKIIVTHNFCDPCTWYQEAILEDGGDGYGAELVDQGDHTTYTSAHTNWIDTKHGRITGEHLIDSDYAVSVTVDGTEKTEDEDYTVDYESGEVTFTSALSDSAVVKATYYYADKSTFTIAPQSGKRLKLLQTKAQFSVNAVIQKPVVYQVYVTDPDDSSSKIPYGTADKYKNGYDLAAMGDETTQSLVFGGIDEDLLFLPFNYVAAKDLKSSSGTEIRIYIEDDEPIDGYYSTLTAYCLSENE